MHLGALWHREQQDVSRTAVAQGAGHPRPAQTIDRRQQMRQRLPPEFVDRFGVFVQALEPGRAGPVALS